MIDPLSLCLSETQPIVTRSLFDDVMVPVYAPATFLPVKGEGLYIWDQAGRQYLDFTAGIAVTSLGHAHPEVVRALVEQAQKVWHVSNVYTNEPVLQLARSLIQATFAERVFFANSGAEANEAALKLSRKVGHLSSPHKNRIVSCFNSFHGRTLFTVSVGGQSKYTDGFEPLPPQLTHIPFNDVAAARATIGDDVCAVIVEPIQGEGGVTPATQAYLEALRALCTAHGALLIFDEVQCGMGRTGDLFAYMGYGVVPDVLTTAKALGNGFPIGAMLTTDEIARAFTVGSHGTTYGGNPLGAAVALSVLNIINQDAFLKRVQEASVLLQKGLQKLIDTYPHILQSLRGRGLLLGIELMPVYHGRAKDIAKLVEKEGLMILNAGPDVLRLAPALIVTDAQIAEALAAFERALSGASL